jgi:hypothetical protein
MTRAGVDPLRCAVFGASRLTSRVARGHPSGVLRRWASYSVLRASPVWPSMATRSTHASHPWGLRANLSVLSPATLRLLPRCGPARPARCAILLRSRTSRHFPVAAFATLLLTHVRSFAAVRLTLRRTESRWFAGPWQTPLVACDEPMLCTPWAMTTRDRPGGWCYRRGRRADSHILGHGLAGRNYSEAL